MMTDLLGKPAWMWASFMAIVVTLLAFDLGVLHREDREIGVRQSLLLSGGYISIALVFGAWVWSYLGAVSGMHFFTGFLIEKSLSIDNIFVIALIFTYLAIPRQYQHRVLFWGILGVIVLRAIMIGLGAVLVTEFSWILYVFGAFLFFTGVKMLLVADNPPNLEDNVLLRLLRALYFALAAMLHRFHYLKYALALVLLFIGAKIFLVGIIGKTQPVISLSVTLGLIMGGILYSLWKTRGANTPQSL